MNYRPYIWMGDRNADLHVRDYRNIQRFKQKLPRRHLSRYMGIGRDPRIAKNERLVAEFIARIIMRRQEVHHTI